VVRRQFTESHQAQRIEELNMPTTVQTATTAERDRTCECTAISAATHLFRVRGRRRRHHQAHRADEAPPPVGRTPQFVAVGLDHTTAGIALRERLAFTDTELPPTLSLLTPRLLDQAAILSTCNRVELYGVARSPHAERELASFLALSRGVEPPDIADALYAFRGDRVAHHLAATAAGLHSLVLGEAQIQGQVRRALGHALTAGTAGPELRRMFESAIAAGRRVRSRTAIGRGHASVPSAGVELVRRRIDSLRESTVVLAGTGAVGELAAKQLVACGPDRLMILGRDYSRAARLAHAYGGHAIAFDRLREVVEEADAVITATSATQPILRRDHVRQRSRPLLVVDLSVPRNVGSDVAELSDVELHTVDDLRAIADRGLAQRRADLPKALAVLEAEMARFTCWLGRRDGWREPIADAGTRVQTGAAAHHPDQFARST
jgi:glutamyl-tRNA reductase